MSFSDALYGFNKKIHGIVGKVDPLAKLYDPALSSSQIVADALGKKSPPAPPGVPNQNDALNAAQSQTDALRMRRGMLANIYAGATNTAPVSGKTTLG